MIDLRSDTVTQPTAAMRRAMFEAPVGDDVLGDDPTVNRLEALAADMTGKEAALFAPSGTQTNLIALLSHCQRGHEYIVGHTGHTYLYEGGGAAVLGGIQPSPIPFAADGSLPLDQVESSIKPDDVHFAITRLVCLENTQAGKVLPMDYLTRYSEVVQRHGLRRHLDGARSANAAVKLGVSLADICQYFDTVSICLSKGLGAPVGSLLVGDRETLSIARRWRKMLGGGMRQAGGLAAAGIYALTHQLDRLQEDHDKALRVAEALRDLPEFIVAEPPQTNMVMLSSEMNIPHLKTYLADKGISILGARWVFHLDISDADVDYLIEVCSNWAPPEAH